MKNKLWNATGIFVQLVVMAIPILIVLALLMVATSSLPLAIVLAVCIHLHMPELGGGGNLAGLKKIFTTFGGPGMT